MIKLNPGIRRLILMVIISIILILSSLYLHFNVITARNTKVYNLSQEDSYRIKGEVRVPEAEGTIYIYLIDSEQFQIPNSGIQTVILKATSGKLEYAFSFVPAGIYGIRSFQDQNGDGKLNRGIKGPKEPWALSWNRGKRFPPRFQDISFRVSKDTIIDLSLIE